MKNKYLSILALLLILAACAQAGPGPSPESLAGQNFVLQSVDGKPYTLKENTPSIAFDAEMRVSGSICNQFFGRGRLEGSKFTVSGLAATRKLCFEQELNKYEQLISAMLMAGVELEYSADTLTMRQGGHSLVYKRSAPRK